MFPELITLYHGIYRIIYIFREWTREKLIFTGEITDKIFYRANEHFFVEEYEVFLIMKN
jgi:hypothetical protein